MEVHNEYMAIFKSTRNRVSTLMHEIEKIHPYEVPEIVELETDRFSKGYRSWLNSSTSDFTITSKKYNLKKNHGK